MTVAQRSTALSFCKWALDKLTQHYPEQTISPRDLERIEHLAAIFKRWVTREPMTPQIQFLRVCDVLGLDPVEVRQILRSL